MSTNCPTVTPPANYPAMYRCWMTAQSRIQRGHSRLPMRKPSSCSILLVFSRSGGEECWMQAKLAEIAAAAYGSGTLKEVAELIWCGRCGCNGLHFLYVDVVALELTIQSGAADPKQPSRQHLVPFCLFEDATDCLSFHVFQIIGGRSAFRPRTWIQEKWYEWMEANPAHRSIYRLPNAIARSMQFSSSRTLPGQSYCSNEFIAAVVSVIFASGE